VIDSALAYAERGYEVLPLNGKMPLTNQGFYDATVNEITIRHWWAKWPDANIGCRPPDDCIILDVDPRNGGELTALGDYPETRTARTGSGGWHVWFAARGRFRGTLVGADGVDIKTANSLVVMPPSTHPVTGQRYRWEVSGRVAPLPEHLIARVVKPPRRVYHDSGSKMTEAQLAGIIRKMEDAITDRNNTLLWCACRLFERNADADAFVQLEMAASYTGLEDDEITRTIESAAKQVGR
jgi:Bifunctional DNA primase/polymerase, N-terminal